MPYISQEDRSHLDYAIDELIRKLSIGDWSAGWVNYSIYRIVRAWFRQRRRYSTIAHIMGTLICVGLEFYRRKGAPYEDEKMDENGDVA